MALVTFAGTLPDHCIVLCTDCRGSIAFFPANVVIKFVVSSSQKVLCERCAKEQGLIAFVYLVMPYFRPTDHGPLGPLGCGAIEQ